MKKIAVGIFVKNGKTLLEKRREDENNYAGVWTFPKGHKRFFEDIEITLIREMKEELNVNIHKYKELIKIKDIDPTSKKEYEHNYFLCLKWSNKIRGTSEQEKLKWIKIEDFWEVPNHLKIDEKVIKLVKKELAKKKAKG